jgi:hypothetical protein
MMRYRDLEYENLTFNPELETWESLGEGWEREISRNSREYIVWVQMSLNQIMDAGLQVDGIYGALTRAAVRAVQQSMRLKVDGIVGPQTEAALVAWAGPTPAGRTIPTIPGSGARILPPALRTLRANIVRIADQEWNRWNTGGVKTETDPRMRPILRDYWLTGVGVRVTDSQLASISWQNSHPWSAAFISWVIRQAGAGSSFRYAAAHAVYVAWAKQNRLAQNANPFKAYRMTEVIPEPGDILCLSRANSGATYDNIAPGMKTHCDIVTEVQANRLVTIGGNVNNTVSRRYPKTDTHGRVIQQPYYAVIKLTS